MRRDAGGSGRRSKCCSAMYEENLKPLPSGDATQVFADILATLRTDASIPNAQAELTPDQVVQWADPELQSLVGRVGRRLLRPGSGVLGIDQLDALLGYARSGHSCLICLNHRSNLDVPSLYALLHDLGRADLFQPIIWIAGRKLEEDVGLTPLLVRGFNRVIVTPKSWLTAELTAEQRRHARQINRAAHRAIHTLRNDGFMFGLFPAGTRTRPGDAATGQALEETDSYLKYFDYMLLGYIEGCTLPVARSRDMTHETPRLDRLRYAFGTVLQTHAWRAEAAQRYRQLTARAATARAIMEDIHALRPTLAQPRDHGEGEIESHRIAPGS